MDLWLGITILIIDLDFITPLETPETADFN